MSERARSILFVCPVEGGVAQVARNSAAALAALGWDVRRIELGGRRSPLREARRALRRERAELRSREVVHIEHGSNDLAVFWFAVFAARLRPDVVTVVHDAPLVVHDPGAGAIGRGTRWRDIVAHRVLSPLIDRPLRRSYARGIAVAMVTSERARAAWVDGSPARTLCLPLAIDVPSAAGAPSQGSHVLFAGYIGPSKGVEALLDAWRLVGEGSSLPLVIASDSTGALGSPYGASLRARSEAGAAPPRWLSGLDDEGFAQLFADAAIVVLPYRRSNPASAMVLMAMAMGRAIVGTEVPALADFATHDTEALIVRTDDTVALADALARLIAEPELRDRLGAAAASRYAREHNWTVHCAALEDAYALASESASHAGAA